MQTEQVSERETVERCAVQLIELYRAITVQSHRNGSASLALLDGEI